MASHYDSDAKLPSTQSEPVQERDQRSGKRYTPTILKVPSLLFACAVAVALIGVVEHLVRKFPHAERTTPLGRHLHAPKAVAANVTSTSITPPAFTTTQARTAYVGVGTSSVTTSSAYVGVGTTPTPAASAYVGVGTSTSLTSVATAYVGTGQKTQQLTPGTTVSGTSRGAYVGTGTTTAAGTGSAAPGSYVRTGVQTTLTTMTYANGDTSVQQVVNYNESWTSTNAFVSTYLPVLLAVLFKQLWSAIYTKSKLLEPFVQLAQPQGASSGILQEYYISSSFIPDPILALFKRHWYILWTSIVYLAVGFLAPLASELIHLDTQYTDCADPKLDANNVCWPPRITVDHSVARATQGILAYVAVMTFTIMAMRLRRPSAVYSDPSSIAGLASLLHHPETVADMRALSGDTSSREMRQHLQGKKYRLAEYQSHSGVSHFGIIPVAPSPYPINPLSPQPSLPPERRRRSLGSVLDWVLGVVLLGLLGVIAAYFKDAADDPFNRFFNRDAFGPRFILTTVATLVSLAWKRVERETSTVSPYSRMSRSAAPAKPSVLARHGNIPLTATVLALVQQRAVFAAAIALVAVLSDVLVIVIGAVPYSAGEIYLELLACSYASMAIVGVMVVGIAGVMVWRRRAPYLPREPDTVAGVLSYVAGSEGVLRVLEGGEFLTTRELERRVVGEGWGFVYGEVGGGRGERRCVVDISATRL